MNRSWNLELVDSMSNLLQEAFPASSQASRRVEFLNSFEAALLSRECAPSQGCNSLRVSLLGRFTVTGSEGMAVDERHWSTQKAMLLFAFVAGRGGRPVADSVLAATFWPDSPDERARTSLRSALHMVRSTLAPLTGEREVVERNRRCRTLTLGMPCVLDTDMFEASVREAAELCERGQHAQALEHLKAAMETYRGEFLEGFLDEWVLSIRAHYSELHLRALHLLARCHLALGEALAAEQVARYATALDTLCEDLHADLIEALVVQGRRGEALRHYRDTVDCFERELGVVPATLRVIHDQFLAEAPCRAPQASSRDLPLPSARRPVATTRRHMTALLAS